MQFAQFFLNPLRLAGCIARLVVASADLDLDCFALLAVKLKRHFARAARRRRHCVQIVLRHHLHDARHRRDVKFLLRVRDTADRNERLHPRLVRLGNLAADVRKNAWRIGAVEDHDVGNAVALGVGQVDLARLILHWIHFDVERRRAALAHRAQRRIDAFRHHVALVHLGRVRTVDPRTLVRRVARILVLLDDQVALVLLLLLHPIVAVRENLLLEEAVENAIHKLDEIRNFGIGLVVVDREHHRERAWILLRVVQSGDALHPRALERQRVARNRIRESLARLLFVRHVVKLDETAL